MCAAHSIIRLLTRWGASQVIKLRERQRERETERKSQRKRQQETEMTDKNHFQTTETRKVV